MNVRVICTDIDGTLLDSRRELSARTISVLQRIGAHMPVILASSRMPAAMRHLQFELGIPHHPMICYNGGLVIQYSGGPSFDVLASTGISPQTVKAICQLTLKTGVHVSLYREDEWHAPRRDYWTEREEKITKVSASITNVHEKIEEWAAQRISVHKIMCMGDQGEINVLEGQLRDQYSEAIHIYRSRPTYLELAPRSVSKGSALEVILQRYGISLGEVLAFGDNYNDIELLKAAGCGVAVANSRDEVKAVANEMTLSSIDDGVAVFLEKYLLPS